MLLMVPSLAYGENRLFIKYRTDLVDVDKPYFETTDTSGSSLVRGAWYDKSNKYLLISLGGTNYHYCGVDNGIWNAFKLASSKGSFYNSSIKGNFDCRIYPVPEYRE